MDNQQNQGAADTFYRNTVMDLFAHKSTQRISNSCPDHASFLFEAMFTYAKSEIKIFCENLSKDVFGRPNVLAAFKRMLHERDVFVEIITQKDPEESDFLNVLRDDKKAKIYCKFSKKIKAENIEQNFSVMDGIAFRYEKDHREKKAFACANDPTNAATLLNNFAIVRGL